MEVGEDTKEYLVKRKNVKKSKQSIVTQQLKKQANQKPSTQLHQTIKL